MKKLTVLPLVFLAFALTSCSALDVVETDAARAFGEVLNTRASNSESDWRLTAPDGSTVLDWDSASVFMVIDAAPFISAGWM
ncbi:MAG: hypothetical protein LBS84_05615 [Clostridiales bacterium]|jgi:hypothetical protein|nr:hypothetical protein [Clostridiales bacterium]